MPSRRTSHQHKFNPYHISEKANRVLNLVLIIMLLIILRVWHLSVVQYDNKLEEARKPQRRIIVEAARRATIRDRFNIPLALNKVQYNAAILYSQFRQIPSVAWKKGTDGKRIKVLKRKEYITALSRTLGEELQLDPSRLEDLIHAKASFYYQIPFIIKEDITEKQYYRLKMMEKDWLGIHVQRIPKRTYPMGRVAADIIGYMGAINRQEYESIIHEMKELEEYLSKHEEGFDPPLPKGITDYQQARHRFKDLQEKAYTVNDYVGKTGIEGQFEEELRGFQGKKSFYSDAKGNFLRELPGSRNPLPGRRFLLSISSELQEYAEKLLIQNEEIREAQISNPDITQQALICKQPWIKGGAIVALDPNNGEVIALASHPRFDPNDFIVSGNSEVNEQKNANIVRWFESEEYLGQVWDLKRPLERELLDPQIKCYDDKLMMTWDNYLSFVLPIGSPLRECFRKINTIKSAVELQQNAETPILKSLSQHYDKVLLLDLCRLVVPGNLFTPELIQVMGQQSLSTYRETSAAMATINPVVRHMTKSLFHEFHFIPWRQENEKEFLKQKRAEEKLTLRYPKPYIDYLDQIEQQMFSEFWTMHRWRLLLAFLQGASMEEDLRPYVDHFANWHWELSQGAHHELPWRNAYTILHNSIAEVDDSIALQYLQTLRSFQDLDRPLLGKYRYLRKTHGQQLEKHLAAAFYPMYGFGYGRSYAYRQAATQGSLFKLVTAYEALVQRYQKLGGREPTVENLNPLEMVDLIQKNGKDLIVGYHADGKPIPQHYKGGRIPKSASGNLGKLDLLHALEVSSNPYFSLLAGDLLESPEDLAKAARLFSFGCKTGIDLPGEIPGKIPKDLSINRTGLYSMAIGQHSLVVTPLQTAVMLSAIANGGHVVKPKIVTLTAGVEREDEELEPIQILPNFLFQDSLSLVGIDFPLFTLSTSYEQKNLVKRFPTEEGRQLFMPDIIRSILLEGMHRVVVKLQQTGISSLSRLYHEHPEAIRDYLDLKDQLAGKTSTSESMENIDLDLRYGTNKYTHVWFGGIVFDSSENESKKTYLFRDCSGRPELVVVVYLRFGKYGKETAPVAAQIVKKWREIKKRMERNGVEPLASTMPSLRSTS